MTTAAKAKPRKPRPPACPARCGVPLDPWLATQGWDRHPICEYPEGITRPVTRRRGKATPVPPQADTLAMADPAPPAPDQAAPEPRLPGYGTKPRAVYDVIEQAGRDGLTAAEAIARVQGERSLGSVGTMIGYMLTSGALVRAPHRRRHDDGTQGDVYTAWRHVPPEHRRKV